MRRQPVTRIHPPPAQIPEDDRLQAIEAEIEQLTVELAHSQRFTQQILDTVAEGVYGIDRNGRCTFINQAALKLLGYADAGEIIGHQTHTLFHHHYPNGEAYPVERCITYQSIDSEQRIFCDNEVFWARDGRSFPVAYWSLPIEPDNHPTAAVITFSDISERREAQKKLAESEKLLRTVLDSQPECVKLISGEGILTQINQKGLRLLDAETPQDILGRNVMTLALPDYHESLRSLLVDVFEGKNGHLLYEIRGLKGTHRWMDMNAVPLTDALGQVYAMLGVSRDITQQKQAEAVIQRLAFYDTLTELPNRRLMLERLQQAYASSERTRQFGAILFIDLDHFKMLNDTRGHEAGDQLLKQVALRISACVRHEDTVARLGGDEFVVILESLGAEESAAATKTKKIAEKIIESINQPFQIGDRPHHTSPSIGVALFRGHELSADELLKRGDTAMYRAKNAGRNTVRFFNQDMQVFVETRNEIETALRGAIEQERLELYFQPQFDRHRQPIGAELLLRWEHDTLGWIPPKMFIHLAEESGLIHPLGDWVLRQACDTLRNWKGQPLTQGLKLSVNVSARQFHEPRFVDEVIERVTQSAIDPALLVLELTESVVLSDIQEAIAKIEALSAFGLKLSMDDFGTGYSSLSYLKSLPLQELKIDQSFVQGVPADHSDAMLVHTIIDLGKNFGLQVVAEGVESEAQFDFLKTYDCDAFQGFLFSRPVPYESLLEVLAHRERRT